MKNKKSLFMLLALLLPLLAAGCAEKNVSTDMGRTGDENMEMHHLHSMMNHGLSMVTEGSNTIMIGYMKMAPKIDAIGHEHGHLMMNMGKKVINHSMNGPEMMRMMKGEHANTAHMNYSHELG
jgi:hypothetical protein